MKKILSSLCVALCLLACNNKTSETANPPAAATTTNNTADTSKVLSVVQDPKSVTLADKFRTLRDAIYNKQKEVVATHFVFPIQADAAERLWMVCEKEPKTTMPKEAFIANFDKIFDATFVKSLLKVKSEDLFNKGKYTTEKINTTSTSSYIDATYDKNTKKLVLTHQLEEGDGEAALIYEFKVNEKGEIMFANFNMAG